MAEVPAPPPPSATQTDPHWQQPHPTQVWGLCWLTERDGSALARGDGFFREHLLVLDLHGYGVTTHHSACPWELPRPRGQF